jgi:hypothetical protein
MTRLLVSFALFALPAAAQTIYSWEDKDGTHYTDDPSMVPNNARMDATLLKAKQKAQPQPQQADDQQVVITDSNPQPKPVATQAAVTQPQQPLAAQPARVDDNVERQWRDRFIEVNRRIETLEKNYRALEKTRPQQVQCSGSAYQPAPSNTYQVDPQTGAPIIPAGTTFYSNNSPATVNGAATTMINGRPYIAVPNCAANPEYERITREMELTQVQLSDARKDLEQLDRIASQNAIPREWRRGW